MKKKMLMLLMVLTLSVSLAACGKNNETNKQESATDTIVTESETKETEETDETESQAIKDTVESAADIETDQDINIVSALGTFDGEKYINDQFKMTITLPTGWEVLSDEEKYEILGLGADIVTSNGSISAEQMEQSMQNVLLLFMAGDLEAVTEEFTGNISITAEKLTGISKLAISTASDYLDMSKGGLLEIEDLNGVPAKYELGDYENVTIAGKEWTLLPTVINVDNGSMMCTQNLIVTIIDDYAIVLTSTYQDETQEARISELIDNISFE